LATARPKRDDAKRALLELRDPAQEKKRVRIDDFKDHLDVLKDLAEPLSRNHTSRGHGPATARREERAAVVPLRGDAANATEASPGDNRG
jgi:hypothetical protein